MLHWGRSNGAHADLQHGNVLLVPVEGTGQLRLKLIDYDRMHVPALAHQPSGELGHPSYQHPQRLREGTYSAAVDRFSHLAIYCAIRCLMAGGRPLWERFNNQENLLFRESDFAEPGQSVLFRDLWTLRDPDAHALVGHLLLATQQPLEHVPLLDELVSGNKVRALNTQQERQVASLVSNGRSAVRPVEVKSISENLDVASGTRIADMRESALRLAPESPRSSLLAEYAAGLLAAAEATADRLDDVGISAKDHPTRRRDRR